MSGQEFPPAGSRSDDIRGYPKVAVRIAAIHGITVLADFIWFPFLPLLALDLAGGDQAIALYWVSASWILMGGLRVFAGPVWGYIADHVGRKPMLIRSQFFAIASAALSAYLDAPWQLCILMAMLGLFSANMTAAVSLASVSVPAAKLSRSLGLVMGAQYLGMTIGPGIGAALMIAGGYMLAIMVAVIIVAGAPIATMLLVPADMVRARGAGGAPLERLRPNAQLWLILLVQMTLFATSYLLTIVAPVVLKALDPARATALTGIAFTFTGVGSALGILFLSGRMFRPGRLGPGLVAGCSGVGLGLFMLAAGDTVLVFIAGTTLVYVLIASMTPTVNSLTALNVPMSRRGTARHSDW